MGEVACCESRMAEQIHWWTERWLELCFLEWLQWSPHPQLLDESICLSASLKKRSNSARLPHFSKLTTSKTKQVCETCSLFKLDNIENAAILQAFLNVLTSQHRKRSNSPWCPQCLNVTTSKTKQSCETSFNFRSWQHQKLSNSARLPSKIESWVQSWQPRNLVPMRFAIFPVHLSKVLRLPRKSDARS